MQPKFSILLLLLLLIVKQNYSWVYPRVISNSSNYIIIDSQSGLSNRLRILAAYLHISTAVFGTTNIMMVWDVNDECPGHFLEVFQPIENVTFITTLDRRILTSYAYMSFQASYASIPYLFKAFNLTYNASYMHHIIRELYSHFIPTEHIQQQADEFILEHDICKKSSIHVRHSDFDHFHSDIVSEEDKNATNYISHTLPSEQVFLMTDNYKTQNHFLSTFNDKIIIYKELPNHSSKLRVTTLPVTLIEVLICMHSKKFLGNEFSSLSNLVVVFQNIRTQLYPDICDDI